MALILLGSDRLAALPNTKLERLGLNFEPKPVMAMLVTAIHACAFESLKSWMAGTSPAMTARDGVTIH